MNKVFGLMLLSGSAIVISATARAEAQSLMIAYPPTNHQTTADRIFFIGTAPSPGSVLINNQPIKRSRAGHFAPSFPLAVGSNTFDIRYQSQTLQIVVIRKATSATIPPGLIFDPDSLTPKIDIAKQNREPICFSALALPNATVTVKLGSQTVSLLPQPAQAQLPASNAILTGRNQPLVSTEINKYAGCTTLAASDKELDLGKPEFQFKHKGQTVTQTALGRVTILSPTQWQVAEVTAPAGIARTGASTDYSRLTPLPKGTQATIIGREGDWWQLDYGGWINSKEIQVLPTGTVPPHATIRSVGYRKLSGSASSPQNNRLEMVFPLSSAVPITLQPGHQSLTLTLHNTTAQTDIIRLDDNPLISRLDWQQVAPGKAQYTFHFKKKQQWGYQLRYEGTSLILSLRSAPILTGSKTQPLAGIKILLDPGHGGQESGAPGPNGYLEKDVNLTVAKLVRTELQKLGATVVMTREDDRDVSLADRVAQIDQEAPAIALSIHYNSLPDDGDLEKVKGVGTFWYNAPAHGLAVFMHNYIVQQLHRPSYGVFWNNLALTRPTSTPAVLLELGFMTNPDEFEWVTNPTEQRKLARTIAQGIKDWFQIVQKIDPK